MQKILFLMFIFMNGVTVALSQTQLNEQLRNDLAVSQKKMFDGFSNGDKSMFAALAGEDYISINADGTYMKKAEALNLVENFKGSTYKILQEETRFYNDIAITTGRANFYLKSVLVADIYFTQTWVWRDGKWLFIGWQGTMTGQPKYYPIYFVLLLVFILVGIVLIVRKKNKNKKFSS